jgi:hypothetical protein
MLELHGVLFANESSLNGLKHKAILFDKLQVLALDSFLSRMSPGFDLARSELHFLRNRNFINAVPPAVARSAIFDGSRGLDIPYATDVAETAAHLFHATGNDARLLSSVTTEIARDSLVRVVSGELNKILGLETTPLYNLNFPRMPPRQSGGGTAHHDVLRVALDSLPLPDDLCSWQDIFDFKAELHDKKWALHRFLKMLATKPMTAPEVRDEI